MCINRIYQFFGLVIFHIPLLCSKTSNMIWIKHSICVSLMNDKKLIFFHGGSRLMSFFLCISLISAIQEHPCSRQILRRTFDHQVSPRIYDWIRNCPLTSRLYPQPLLVPFSSCWDGIALIFFLSIIASFLLAANGDATTSNGTENIHALLRPSTPGMSGR